MMRGGPELALPPPSSLKVLIKNTAQGYQGGINLIPNQYPLNIHLQQKKMHLYPILRLC